MSSFARSTHHLADQIKDSTTSVLADFGAHAMKMMSSARDQEAHVVDVALERLGLQRRQSAIRPAVYFAAGALVAGGVALVLSPTIGKRIRTQILDLLGAAKDAEKEMEKRVDSLLSDAKSAEGKALESKALDGKTGDAKSPAAAPIDRPWTTPSNHS